MHLISEALKDGHLVATNINLNVEYLVPAYNDTRWFRIPDFPNAEDLEGLPLGNPGMEWRKGELDPVMLDTFREENNGLLVIDEAGNVLSAREWAGAERQKLNNWLTQSRKYGWNLLFLSQHVGQVDKQIRDALIEVQGTVRRADKMAVPLLSPLWKYFTGKKLTLPKFHVVALRYGFAVGAPLTDRLMYRGVDFYKAYNTLQKVHPDTGQTGVSFGLSAYQLKGRYMNKWDLRRQMAAGGLVIGLLLGAAGGYAARHFKPKPGEAIVVESVDAAIKVKGVMRDGDGRQVVLLTDGRSAVVQAVKADARGTRYLVGATWYGS